MRSKRLPWALTVCSVAALLLSAAPAPADTLDGVARPERYVTDAAGVIDPASSAALGRLLEEVERLTTAQVLVVTVETTGGAPALDYAVSLANRWRLGQGGADNGVLILVAVEDREYAVAVGDGLRNVLTDDFLSATASRVFPPAFRRGAYGEGLLAASEAIALKLESKYGVTLSTLRRAARPSRPKAASAQTPPQSPAARPAVQAEADPYAPAPPKAATRPVAVPVSSRTPAPATYRPASRTQSPPFLFAVAGLCIAAASAFLIFLFARVRRAGVFGGIRRAANALADSLAADLATDFERADEESDDDEGGFWSPLRRGPFAGGIFGEGSARKSHSGFSFGRSHHGVTHAGSFGGHSAGIGSHSTGRFSGGGGGHTSGGIRGKW